jgi:MFS family permease
MRFSRAAEAALPATSVSRSLEPASALANPQFRLLFAGNVVTMLAFGMMQVVQGVLAFDLTGRNSSVGFVAMGMGIPMLLFGPIGGAMSDRYSKRMLLMFGQAAVGSVFMLVGILTALDVITIWLLAGLTLLMGCTFAILMPARQAWVGDLLQGPALAHGVALQQLAMNGTRIVGPLAAGGMISLAVIGTGGTYMVMASLFVAAIGLLLVMEATQARPRAATSVLGDMRQGLAYTWHAHDVRLLMLIFAGVVLSAFSYQQLMPGFLEHELDQPASRVGVMYGATAIGGIVLTLFLARGRIGNSATTLMFVCGGGVACSVVLLAVAPTFLTALGAASLVGATSSGFQMCNQVNLMQRTDPAFFGRVMSLTMTAFGLQMIVGFPAGAVADAIGERAALGLLGILCLVIVSAAVLRSRPLRAPAVAPSLARAADD